MLSHNLKTILVTHILSIFDPENVTRRKKSPNFKKMNGNVLSYYFRNFQNAKERFLDECIFRKIYFIISICMHA